MLVDAITIFCGLLLAFGAAWVATALDRLEKG